MFILDVDECASGAHNCSQVCTDTMGSFKCDCLLGYETYKDGYSCFGMKESNNDHCVKLQMPVLVTVNWTIMKCTMHGNVFSMDYMSDDI